jgi:hypothetical protein
MLQNIPTVTLVMEPVENHGHEITQVATTGCLRH